MSWGVAYRTQFAFKLWNNTRKIQIFLLWISSRFSCKACKCVWTVRRELFLVEMRAGTSRIEAQRRVCIIWNSTVPVLLQLTPTICGSAWKTHVAVRGIIFGSQHRHEIFVFSCSPCTSHMLSRPKGWRRFGKKISTSVATLAPHTTSCLYVFKFTEAGKGISKLKIASSVLPYLVLMISYRVKTFSIRSVWSTWVKISICSHIWIMCFIALSLTVSCSICQKTTRTSFHKQRRFCFWSPCNTRL